MIILRDVSHEEHKAVHDKLLEMEKAGLCKRGYKGNSHVVIWKWTDDGQSRLNPQEDCWEVAARCVLPPNRW